MVNESCQPVSQNMTGQMGYQLYLVCFLYPCIFFGFYCLCDENDGHDSYKTRMTVSLPVRRESKTIKDISVIKTKLAVQNIYLKSSNESTTIIDFFVES